MINKRKKYDSSFKAKVAIEAIRERETLNELAAKYELSPVMINRWKKEFIER
jgi:putative transposase